MKILLFKLFNKTMSFIGLQVVRKSTLDSLIQTQTDETSISVIDPQVETDNTLLKILENQEGLKEEFNRRLQFIETKVSNGYKQNIIDGIASKWEIVDYLRPSVNEQGSSLICPLCSHEDDKSSYKAYHSHCIFGGGDLTRFQCPACDVIFGDQKMLDLSKEQLSQEYELHYRVYEEGDSTEQEIRAFELLSPKKDGVYLNYGAGAWSQSVMKLRAEGWNVFAFEPHDSAESNVEYLIKNKDQLSKIRFDGVFTNNVLEHFRYPEEDLFFISTILKPGALMSHATPCYEYLYEYTRFHLFFYLGRSREVLAKKANLSIKDFVVDGEFMCTVFKGNQ